MGLVISMKTVKKDYREHKDCCFFCKYSRHDWDDIACVHPDEHNKECYVEVFGFCEWFESEET